MAITMTAPSGKDMLPIQRRAFGFVVDSVQRWFSVCDEFLDEQRALFLKPSPTPEELAKHREALSFLIRTTRTLQGQMLDPEFPDHSQARQLETRLRQLEESWTLLHQPMSEQEADNIIGKIFPNAR